MSLDPSTESVTTRKLQRVGSGTYTVSVPKEWADAHRLEAGNTVHLYTHTDGSIVVRSAERDGGSLESVRLEVDGTSSEVLRRTLRAAYAAGFAEVTLVPEESFTSEARRAVRSTATTLVGAAVSVEREDEVVVRSLLDTADVSVRQSVVQLQFVALSIHRRATEAFLAADAGAHAGLEEHYEEATRPFEMVSRHFDRSLISIRELDRLGTSRPALFDYHETARRLDRIAERGVRIARLARWLSGPLPESTAADVGRAAAASRDVVEAATGAVIEDGGFDAAHGAFDGWEGARSDVDALEQSLLDGSAELPGASTADAVVLGRAVAELEGTARDGRAVAEVALEAATRADRP